MEIPDRLRHRPQFRGFPIPYIQFIGADGIPDFKINDERLRHEALDRKLCGLCGLTLDPIIVLIGGPSCEQYRLFIDPPMHEDCARYAAKVCPYLSKADAGYASMPSRHLGEKGTVTVVHENVSPIRPEKLGIFYSRGYQLVINEGTLYVKAKPFLRIDWNAMPRSQQ